MKQRQKLSMPAETSNAASLQMFNLSDALAEFRAQLEHDAGAPVCEIETSAATLLDDLCTFLGFGPEKRTKIIGSKSDAAALVEAFLDAHAPTMTERQ